MASPWTAYESPLGRLTIVLSPGGALRGDPLSRRPGDARGGRLRDAAGDRSARPVLRRREAAVRARRRAGRDRFQIAVWERLREIPYGSTVSYGEIADDLGEAAFPAGLEPHERARAVGAEVGRTPVPIVIPCHRVIGADGSLTGYGGGLERKRALLDLESSQLALL